MSKEYYRIEKDIPMDAPSLRNKYPIRDMLVGDSFLVPIIDAGSVRGSLNAFSIRQEPVWSFKTKLSPDRRSLRVWRTA